MGQTVSVHFMLDSDVKKNMEIYSENNTRYLEGVMQDVKDGKAHFTEHELIYCLSGAL